MTVCLLTGATGSFGEAFLRRVLPEDWTVRAFSRDEFKQYELRAQLALEWPDSSKGIRWLIGDVRDRSRLTRAARGVDVVVHAAALKQVVSCEYNPLETIKTNVDGSANVVEACLDAGVERAVLLSSDKAVHPVNIYGKTKACAESLWVDANNYAGTRFAVVRYGNVKGSRGSILGIPGPIQLTDSRATRFWMSVDDAVSTVLLALEETLGGEVFIPKIGAQRVATLIARAIGEETGLRRGEKLHEQLVSDEEIPRTWDCGSHYRICDYEPEGALKVPEEFRYSSEQTAA